jgi:hypothetical protein
MFGDLTFAGGTFADIFLVSGQIEYSYRKGRTAVIAVIPENGSMVTGVSAKFIRSKVEAILPEEGTITTNVIVRKLRTKVEKTKTVNTNPQPGL